MKNMEMERVGNSNMIEQFPKPELPKYMWSKNLSVGLLPQNKPALEIPKAIKYNKTEPV